MVEIKTSQELIQGGENLEIVNIVNTFYEFVVKEQSNEVIAGGL